MTTWFVLVLFLHSTEGKPTALKQEAGEPKAFATATACFNERNNDLPGMHRQFGKDFAHLECYEVSDEGVRPAKRPDVGALEDEA